MHINNPACYECPKRKDGIHYWCRIENRKAKCEYCKQILSEKDAVVIKFVSKGKSTALIRIVSYCLAEGKELTIGCSDKESRLQELKTWFPDADLTITDLGIKICNRK